MGMVGNLLRVTPEELEAYKLDSAALEERIFESVTADPHLLDIDKTWSAIFYALTGCGISAMDQAQPPLSWTLFSGQVLDEEQDMGYGPAQYCTAEQAKDVMEALQKISSEEFIQKCEVLKSNNDDVYPSGAWKDEEIPYLADNFEAMKKFYKEAADHHQAVITFIS